MKTGRNNTVKYLSRIDERPDGVFVRCNSCNDWKPADGFHVAKGKYKSICKSCHREKYGKGSGYRSPSSIGKSEYVDKQKEAWLNEPQTCTCCGESRPRKQFYNEKQKRYLPYCCSRRRSWDEIDRDIAEQMKTCFECGLRLPFDEFTDGKNGRDKKRPYCKCCEAARAKTHTGKHGRIELIRKTDDGTATTVILSKMLRETDNCQYCGVKMSQDYPVGPNNKTIDHNVPLSRGGKHTLSNISIMCMSCNSAKGQRTLDEFAIVKKKRAKA